jgi:hypothetical protein
MTAAGKNSDKGGPMSFRILREDNLTNWHVGEGDREGVEFFCRCRGEDILEAVVESPCSARDASGLGEINVRSSLGDPEGGLGVCLVDSSTLWDCRRLGDFCGEEGFWASV